MSKWLAMLCVIFQYFPLRFVTFGSTEKYKLGIGNIFLPAVGSQRIDVTTNVKTNNYQSCSNQSVALMSCSTPFWLCNPQVSSFQGTARSKHKPTFCKCSDLHSKDPRQSYSTYGTKLIFSKRWLCIKA